MYVSTKNYMLSGSHALVHSPQLSLLSLCSSSFSHSIHLGNHIYTLDG